jgi:hypothetical protein
LVQLISTLLDSTIQNVAANDLLLSVPWPKINRTLYYSQKQCFSKFVWSANRNI